MAILAKVKTNFGELRDLYIRLNNVEASNHGAESYAKFRGFISEQSFLDGSSYAWEHDIMFTPDVALPLWEQAYDVLKTDPVLLSAAVDA